MDKIKIYEVKQMEKKWYESKTIQGIIVAVLGGLLFTFGGAKELGQGILIAGLGWAGIGFRAAQK